MDIEELFDNGLVSAAVLFVIAALVLCFIFADFDLFPASGSAQGIISFQEKNGIWQKEFVCWRDTPYADCERFVGESGKIYEPGTYKINYSCERFVWSWEAASICRITNSTWVSK